MTIRQGFPTPLRNHYKVYVRSCTYNQSLYIEDCLNGVAMQKTDFPFVHHVIDDCSTDGEQEVIKAWIVKNCNVTTAEYYDNDICTITFAKSNSNPNYTIAAYFLKRNMYRERVEKEKLYTLWREICPYEAFCEGDDYWIVQYKLQKQFVFLEGNHDYSMIFTNINYRFSNENKFIEKYLTSGNRRPSISFADHLLNTNFIAPCSWMYRTCSVYNFDKPYVDGTFVLALDFFAKGKVKFLDEVTTVYRCLPESASHSSSKKKWYMHLRGVIETKKEFIRKYPELISSEEVFIFYKAWYRRAYLMYYMKDMQEFNNALSFFLHSSDYLHFFFYKMPKPILLFIIKRRYKKYIC